jgi:hypothetical protein
MPAAHRGVVDGLTPLFDLFIFFSNAIAVIRVDDVEITPHRLADAFLGLVAEHLFLGRVYVDDLTRFVDDLDRVTANLGDDSIALFALAERLARPLVA